MPETNAKKSLGILATAGLAPYKEKAGEEYM
ncbi:MAG: RNA polymerase-binding protein DksA, partial [Vibrionaceae bacterium]